MNGKLWPGLRPSGGWFATLTLAMVLSQASLVASADPSAQKPLPSFAKVKAVLARHLEGSGIAANDLLAQSDVEPIFKLLQMLGWDVVDSREIMALVLPDGNFLVRQLKTKAGHKFMRQVAEYPQAYDRLDQLSHLPQGKQMIRDLIRGPDGYKMLEYMTTTPGGANLNEMLSQTPAGEDFTRPTQRIYTPHQLLYQLRYSYDAELQRRAKTSQAVEANGQAS